MPVSVVNMRTALRTTLGWGKAGSSKIVVVRDVHGVMRAIEDRALMRAHKTASLVVPDGMPLTWIGRLRGYGKKIGRTPGTDLMEAVCRHSANAQLTHYFFGGRPGVAQKMVGRLCARYPSLRVAGIYSPPIRGIEGDRPFDEVELHEIGNIAAANPDFIWVGLSSPKQEYWMMKAAPMLPHGVFFGVGAAFDFQSGDVNRAPKIIQNLGLEWLHRLLSEPRRLWKRYLILAPRFFIKVVFEQASGSWKR